MTEASASTSNREAQFLEWPAQVAPQDVAAVLTEPVAIAAPQPA